MAASEIRAGRAYIQLTAKDKLTKGLQNAKKKLRNFSKSVSELGTKLISIGTIVGGALTATSAYFTKVGDSFDKMSGRTGASVQWLSQMAFAAQQSGASIQAVQDAVKEMNKRFGEAQRGQGEMLKGLQMLGMTVKDLQGLSPQVMFEIISDRIAMVKDQAKRTKIIDSMFGGGANKLQNLFGRIKGNIKSLRQQADKLGLTISTQDAKNAAALADAWGRLVSIGKMLVFTVGGALAPALQKFADGFKLIAVEISYFVNQNKELVYSVAKWAILFIGAGIGLKVFAKVLDGFGILLSASGTALNFYGKTFVFFGKAISTVSKGVMLGFSKIPTLFSVIGTAIKTALVAIMSPIGLITTAVVGLAVIIAYQTGLIDKAWQFIKDGVAELGRAFGITVDKMAADWKALSNYCSETWQGIKDAFNGGDLKLAVKVLWASIKVLWLQGIHPLTETWVGFKAMLADGWTNLWYGMADVFSACFYALKDGWSATAFWLLEAWNSVVSGLTIAWNATVNGLTVAWNSVTSFLTEAWSATVNGIVKVWNKVMGTVMKAWIKLKGLFSDKVNVDVEVSKIDAEINAKNSALDDETAGVVRKNEQRALAQKRKYEQQKQSQRKQRQEQKAATKQLRDAERAENQRARNADRQRIEQQRKAELQANLNTYADQMGEANRTLEQAKKQRRAYLDQAKRKAQQAEKEKQARLQQKKDTVERNITQVKGSVKGSFYADAISGVKVNTDQKRTADGVQKLVAETRKTNDLLKKNNSNSNSGTLVFA